MGTRGFRIIKFRGRYWIFYNHSDSYPDGLGKALVDAIPADLEGYRKWLQSQRDQFAKWDSMLQNFLTLQPEDMRKLDSSEAHTSIFHTAFDERLERDVPPCYKTGFNDLWIEWTYTIDLDREILSVDSGAHFHLIHIPKNDAWIRALFHDDRGDRYLLPQLVPAESIATLSLNPPSFAACTKYEALQTRLVIPRRSDHISPSRLTGPKFQWMLFNHFQKSQQRDLSVSLLSWQAQDLPFRELAFYILCLAAGGEYLTLVDQRRVKKLYDEGLYLGIRTDSVSGSYTELATSLGVGYHMDGLPMGSAPTETKYWFEGALICLVPQLDNPGVLGKAIADAIDYGCASCIATSFNAVLISIEHLVLIKSLPDGSVERTELLPLIPITSHLSKDPRARYGDQALDAFYDAYFTKNNQEVEEGDRTSVEQLSEHSDAEMSNEGREDEVEVAPLHATPVTAVTEDLIQHSFMALLQLFEATTREALRPTQPNEARLPEEICEMVLRNVSDTKTYNSCLKVSRRFRLTCQQRPLVTDNIVLLEPVPNEPIPLITKKEGRGIQKPLPPPDFLAVEVSSDQQMKVWLHSSGGRGDPLTCLVVAGHEWNRKTYVDNSSVVFIGSCVPAPGANEADERENSAARRQHEVPSCYGSEGTLWHVLFKAYSINADSAAITIGHFWDQVIRHLRRDQMSATLNAVRPAWILPTNTVSYFGLGFVDVSGGADAIQKFQAFHYLYLSVKRASKYCDSLWDDIIRETTQSLNQPDDENKRYHRPDGEVKGADNPYVILAVGVETRLFRWQQGFDDSADEAARRQQSASSFLRELKPGEVFNILEKTDREEIERFLNEAEQHLDIIKAKFSRAPMDEVD